MIFTVVMVSYNRDTKLKESINQLLNTSVDEIVVVDNNSSQTTREILIELSQLDSRLKIIQLEENRGASYGFFVGLRSLESKYKTFVTTFLDDDAYFTQDFLDRLSYFYKNIGTGFSYISPKVVNKEGHRLNMNRPMTIVPNSLFKTLKYLTNRRTFGDKSESVEAASFIGLTILNNDGDNYSSLIPQDYFIYFDDLTFTYRLSKVLNVRGMLNDNLNVIHDIENGIREYDEFRLSYILKNSIKFNKEIEGKMFIYPIFLHLYHFISHVKKFKLKVFIRALLRKR